MALHPTDQRKSNSIVWKCQCDCGEVKYTPRKCLIDGSVTTCGKVECRKFNYIDLSGQRFGRLIVLKRCGHHTNKSGKKNILWQCICDCGNISLVQSRNLRVGKTSSCGCWATEQKSLPKKYFTDTEKGKAYVYKNYKQSAKKRNVFFELTKEQLQKLTSSNCFYCGLSPDKSNQSYEYSYNGIDRKDNNQGYIETNSISCCKDCNYIKGDRLSYDEMLLLKPTLIKIRELREQNGK